MGIDNIYKEATKFGLGAEYLINIFNSSKGLIPSREWKKKSLESHGLKQTQ